MSRFLFLALLLLAPPSRAETPVRQDGAALRSLVQQFLEQQTGGLPGKVSITVGPFDARSALPACAAPQPFQAPGARAWGKTTVGVRCSAPANWTVYLQAQVAVLADYVAAAVPLAAGQSIEQHQLVILQGDIAAMPNGIVTDLAQAVGRSPAVSLASGTPLRLDILKSKPVVQQGQLVRVVSGSAAFRVSNEARAIGSAADGQVVQVRTAGGAVLSGVAKAGGVVEVVF
jgi:flagella basal body P-ring formation protein FlgA